MSYGFKVRVWGDRACFSRPEMKAERVSYDVITPSAARGILEAIHYKPAIRWCIDYIHVINPIKFDNIRRNEVLGKANATGDIGTIYKYADDSNIRLQRGTMLLRDVCYIIAAHFELTERAGSEDTEEKHYNIMKRRLEKGQCFHQPYFGCREFPAAFELCGNELPISCYAGETKDLGFMLYDIDYTKDKQPVFFRAVMVDGIIDTRRGKEGGLS